MKKLTKRDFLFYQILFALWQLIVYYADTFCYSAPNNPLEMDCKLVYNKGLTIMRITVPQIKPFSSHYTLEEMKDILQNYLTYALLPNSNISPYCGGDTIFDIVESLFIDAVLSDPQNTNNLMINVVYVCDPISFNYYKSYHSVKNI